jgi:hypothetical protein
MSMCLILFHVDALTCLIAASMFCCAAFQHLGSSKFDVPRDRQEKRSADNYVSPRLVSVVLHVGSVCECGLNSGWFAANGSGSLTLCQTEDGICDWGCHDE